MFFTISACAGILEQSMWARNRVGIRLSYPARQATEAGGIDCLESIPGLLKSLKIPSLCTQVSLTTEKQVKGTVASLYRE